MKAKEYTKLFVDKLDASENKEEDLPKIVGEIAKMFVLESGDIIKARKCSTSEAYASVFDELDSKWKAFARQINSKYKVDFLREDGFVLVLESEFPDMFEIWLTVIMGITDKRNRKEMGKILTQIPEESFTMKKSTYSPLVTFGILGSIIRNQQEN